MHAKLARNQRLRSAAGPAHTLLQTALDTYRGSNSLQHRRLGAAASSTRRRQASQRVGVRMADCLLA